MVLKRMPWIALLVILMTSCGPDDKSKTDHAKNPQAAPPRPAPTQPGVRKRPIGPPDPAGHIVRQSPSSMAKLPLEGITMSGVTMDKKYALFLSNRGYLSVLNLQTQTFEQTIRTSARPTWMAIRKDVYLSTINGEILQISLPDGETVKRAQKPGCEINFFTAPSGRHFKEIFWVTAHNRKRRGGAYQTNVFRCNLAQNKFVDPSEPAQLYQMGNLSYDGARFVWRGSGTLISPMRNFRDLKERKQMASHPIGPFLSQPHEGLPYWFGYNRMVVENSGRNGDWKNKVVFPVHEDWAYLQVDADTSTVSLRELEDGFPERCSWKLKECPETGILKQLNPQGGSFGVQRGTRFHVFIVSGRGNVYMDSSTVKAKPVATPPKTLAKSAKDSKRIPISGTPTGLCLSEQATELFVCHEQSNTIEVIDTETCKQAHVIRTNSPRFVLSRGQDIYVANHADGTVSVFSGGAGWKLQKKYKLPTSGTEFLSAPQGKYFSNKILVTCEDVGNRGKYKTYELNLKTDVIREFKKGKSVDYTGKTVAYDKMIQYGNTSVWFHKYGRMYSVDPCVALIPFPCGRLALSRTDPIYYRIFGNGITAHECSIDSPTLNVWTVPGGIPRDMVVAGRVKKQSFIIGYDREQELLMKIDLPKTNLKEIETGDYFTYGIPNTVLTDVPVKCLPFGKRVLGEYRPEMETCSGSKDNTFTVSKDGVLQWTPKPIDSRHMVPGEQARARRAWVSVTRKVPAGTPLEESPKREQSRIRTKTLSQQTVTFMQSPADFMRKKEFHMLLSKNPRLSYTASGNGIVLHEGKLVRILSEDGGEVVQKMKLQTVYWQIEDRPEYFVGLRKGGIDLIDKTDLHIRKSVALDTHETSTICLHPEKRVTYVSMSLPMPPPAQSRKTWRIVAVSEASGKSVVTKSGYGRILLTSPRLKRLYAVCPGVSRPISFALTSGKLPTNARGGGGDSSVICYGLDGYSPVVQSADILGENKFRRFLPGKKLALLQEELPDFKLEYNGSMSKDVEVHRNYYASRPGVCHPYLNYFWRGGPSLGMWQDRTGFADRTDPLKGSRRLIPVSHAVKRERKLDQAFFTPDGLHVLIQADRTLYCCKLDLSDEDRARIVQAKK